MAELLIVVAIIVILAGVAFIAVQNHQKSMTVLEYDAIAKEIFIAAQNHLTMAESQGYSNITGSDLGAPARSVVDQAEPNYSATNPDYFYIEVLHGVPTAGAKMLDLMLPFGAIDATIYNGDFIIRYQKSSATVLDVFYSNPNQSSMLTAKGITLSGQYDTLMKDYRGATKANDRRNLMVGWFGDAKALPIGKQLTDPVITVHNEEKLWVEVKYTQFDPTQLVPEESLVLIVKGKSSNARTALQLFSSNTSHLEKDDRIDPTPGSTYPGTYKVSLDDITKVTTRGGLHFKNLPSDVATSQFFPGEDIEIEAVAYNNNALTNIAYSGKVVTNSLFSKISLNSTTNKYTAEISNIRHLENLDKLISDVNNTSSTVKIESAKQVSDISWPGFTVKIGGASPSVKIYKHNDGPTAGTVTNCYYPISPDYSLTYDGQSRKIEGIKVDYTGDAGLFGSIVNDSSNESVTEIKNLKLVDFDIQGTTNAGALAGTLTNCKASNVLAVNSSGAATSSIRSTAANSNAGGLIGSVSNTSTLPIEYCAAAVIVNGGSGAAGGLIGNANGTVTGCYSGGHTSGGKYVVTGGYDVTGATAGGLVGDAGSSSIINSYSTCSVSGTTAGGFVGTASGDIKNCYCTGLINQNGTTIGAFSGSTLSENSSGNSYYSIVNELTDESGQFTGKYLLGTPSQEDDDDDQDPGPFDISTAAYNAIAKYTQTAYPYDVTGNNNLNMLYNGVYLLKGIADYGLPTTGDFFVKDHYGDWPAEEIFVIN